MDESLSEQTAGEVEAQRFPSLVLFLEGGALEAMLCKSDNPNPLTSFQLKDRLRTENVSDLCFDDAAVESLIENAKENRPFSIVIAEAIDAEVSIKISRDKMQVMATAIPASGGKCLTVESILRLLVDAGINQKLIEKEAVVSLTKITEETEICVAKGIKPIPGKDTQFVQLYKISDENAPKIQDDNNANFFDTKRYLSIKEGDELMYRVPPGEGTEGLDVLGKSIKPKKGKNLKFKKQQGSGVSPDNKNVLIAKIAGHPVYEAQGVKIDDSLTLPRADLDSGNIKYEGSVVIEGDVHPQVRVEATGDIFVKGIVENATLVAGNNIVIGGGVVSESIPEDDGTVKYTTRLTAGSDIHAIFLNLAKVRAGQDIIVKSYSMHCDLKARNNILVGEAGGKGVIVGGHCHAGVSITANVLGSQAYVQTHLSCGEIADLGAEKAALKRKYRNRKSEAEQLNLILDKIAEDNNKLLGSFPLNRKNKISGVLAQLEADVVEIKDEIEQINDRVKAAANVCIQVKKVIYPNIRLTMNGTTYLQRKERKKCRIFIKNGNVAIES